MKAKVISLANHLLDYLFGVKIRRTRWPESKKPEWPDSAPVGMVESFTRKAITGWVSANAIDYPIKVTLNINGCPVNSTWANVATSRNTTGRAQSFYIAVKGIWDFCKKNDRITVRVGDKVLPIYGKGAFKKPRNSGAKSLNDLSALLANDHLFNKYGVLQLSKKLDTPWQRQTIELYKKTTKILEKNYSITPFLIYGSLLGQVREGGFLGHDDDFDIAYVSKHRSGPDTAKEVVGIANTLMENGLNVELRATTIHIHDKSNPEARLDLFHLFFNHKDELAFAFGVAGTSQFKLSDWKGVTKGKFAGYSVSVPHNAEKLVEYIYGSTWRTPILGFNWNHARTRREMSAIVSRKSRDRFNESNRLYKQ